MNQKHLWDWRFPRLAGAIQILSCYLRRGRWRNHRIILLPVLTLALCAAGLLAQVPPAMPRVPRMRGHYLLLVNTAAASRMNSQKLAQFGRSPYDGLAVSFLDAYETTSVPAAGKMEAQIASWKAPIGKQIWPWVYLNRMIGANPAGQNAYISVPYFQVFQGLDLDGTAGAQRDFLETWRNALRTAKATAVPGIVFDPEFYNNYSAYDVGELANMRSVSVEQAIAQLRQLGARMAQSAAGEYPGATLWFLFTGFTRPEYRVIQGKPYYFAATYIVQGVLDEIQKDHLSLRLISGGSVGLGYCHKSLDDLRRAIDRRQSILGPWLAKYSGVLELAGTITLWSDPQAKRSWVAQGECGASSALTVEDLEPYLELLFRTYRYNWIYGSPNGGYVAFEPTVAARFDAVITRAVAAARGKD